MGVFEHFPYTNFHDINLDRILERTKEAEANAASSAADAQAAAADAATADSNATLALNTANNANNTAVNAKNTADDAAADAAEALSKANTAISVLQNNFVQCPLEVDENDVVTIGAGYTGSISDLCAAILTGNVIFTTDIGLYIPADSKAFVNNIIQVLTTLQVDIIFRNILHNDLILADIKLVFSYDADAETGSFTSGTNKLYQTSLTAI